MSIFSNQKKFKGLRISIFQSSPERLPALLLKKKLNNEWSWLIETSFYYYKMEHNNSVTNENGRWITVLGNPFICFKDLQMTVA